MIIVNGFQPLTVITKHSILDGAAALDPSLKTHTKNRRLNIGAVTKLDDCFAMCQH